MTKLDFENADRATRSPYSKRRWGGKFRPGNPYHVCGYCGASLGRMSEKRVCTCPANQEALNR